jgi:FkbM family methyltransferase
MKLPACTLRKEEVFIHIPDYVLRKTLSTYGLPQMLWTRVRRLLVHRFNDPACTFTIHGRALRLPLSHELPTYLRLLPLYDRLPGRLSAYLHARYGALKGLDVGANIGDTLAAVYGDENDLFLAVEPEPKFNHYLRQNWNLPSVKIINLACSACSGSQRYHIDEKFGTASLHKNPAGIEIETITVDDLLGVYPQFNGLHLIKVDTDGNDFAVLAGARQTLTGQPAVLFESDVFGNPRYVEDCLDTLALFGSAGYRSMLVYDKFGYPTGRYDLGDLTHFRELLFYQLTKKYIYFDILLMKESDLLPFYALEKNFFLATLPDQKLRASAEKAR